MEKIALNIDPDELTIGDLEDFEDVVGKSVDEVIRPVPVLDVDGNRKFDSKGRPEMTTKVPAKALRALVWIIRRKAEPEFTFEDARNIRVTSLVLTAPSQADQGNG